MVISCPSPHNPYTEGVVVVCITKNKAIQIEGPSPWGANLTNILSEMFVTTKMNR
jgi:hypothetical protein